MDPKVVQHNLGIGRFYTYNGYVLPSVTTINHAFGEFSGQELDERAQELLNEKAEKGNKFHEKIQAFFAGAEVSASNEEELGGLAVVFELMVKELREKEITPEQIFIEETVFEGDAGVAGTVDVVIPEHIFELKRGALRQDHRIQAAAYLEALNMDCITLVSGVANHFETIRKGSREHEDLLDEYYRRLEQYLSRYQKQIKGLFPEHKIPTIYALQVD